MENIPTPKLPEGYTAFAKSIKDLAVLNNIDNFVLSIKPKYQDGLYTQGFSVHGEVKIHYWQTDGRGRPSENLRLIFDGSHTVELIKNPESSN